MHTIFISHDTADAGTARGLVDSLESDHLPCWIAPRDIPAGVNYGDAISDAITSAGALVFLVSQESITSQFCKKEVEYATSVGTTLIPVRLDETALTGGLRFFLAGNQWIDTSGSEDWIAQLAGTLGHLRIEDATGSSDPKASVVSPAASRPSGLASPIGERADLEIGQLSVEDCRSLLATMKFLRDGRGAPEGRRRGRFKAGWRSAASGRTYADRTLEDLKWDNLGWRMGDQFGEQPGEFMDTAFESFATVWQQDHA